MTEENPRSPMLPQRHSPQSTMCPSLCLRAKDHLRTPSGGLPEVLRFTQIVQSGSAADWRPPKSGDQATQQDDGLTWLHEECFLTEQLESRVRGNSPPGPRVPAPPSHCAGSPLEFPVLTQVSVRQSVDTCLRRVQKFARAAENGVVAAPVPE